MYIYIHKHTHTHTHNNINVFLTGQVSRSSANELINKSEVSPALKMFSDYLMSINCVFAWY